MIAQRSRRGRLAPLLFVLLFVLLLGLGAALQGCSCEERPRHVNAATAAAITPAHPGEALAKVHCSGCHLYVAPSLLDRHTWESFVLVRMGAYMGIFWDTRQYFDRLPARWLEPGEGGRRVLRAGIYPKTPRLSRVDWEAIVDYYLSHAPQATHGAADALPVAANTERFKATPLKQGAGLEAVTGVRIDGPRKALYAAFHTQRLIKMDLRGQTIDTIQGVRAVVAIDPGEDRFSITDIGQMIGADGRTGRFRSGRSFEQLRDQAEDVRLDALMRPVHGTWHDLDQDGLEDLLISEFGHQLGALTWRKNLGDGRFEARVLNDADGAIRARVHDFDDDGRPDIISAMANGDEGIDLYLNQGGGEFARRRLMRFPPTTGTTGLSLVDYNADGRMDILYVQGDNADYPAILKPHHGIRIFVDRGNLRFEEVVHLPLNGAYGAHAADFDLDGDLDIAAIAFYADWRKDPAEGFVYFENQGQDRFKAFTVPAAANGRWMVCDAGDMDQDGDVDLLLGAFNAASAEVPAGVLERWRSAETPLLLLENRTR